MGQGSVCTHPPALDAVEAGLPSLQRRCRVCCEAASRDARRALTLSQDERQLPRSQPRCKEVGSRSRAQASRKEKRPRITSTQPQSLREGHRASDTWWNHLPYPG